MGNEWMDNSGKMREHMEDVKNANKKGCDHKPDPGEIGVGPTTCAKCGIKIKKGFIPYE